MPWRPLSGVFIFRCLLGSPETLVFYLVACGSSPGSRHVLPCRVVVLWTPQEA
jgi:hypothetical protein